MGIVPTYGGMRPKSQPGQAEELGAPGVGAVVAQGRKALHLGDALIRPERLAAAHDALHTWIA